MIKAVIFDLDNTLYDYDENHAVAMKALNKVGSDIFDVTEEQFAAAYEEAKAAVKKHMSQESAAQHSRVLYAQKVAETFGKNVIRAVPRLYDAYWNTFLENMRPYDGAGEFLQKLKDKGISTAVCTDMTAHIQYRKLVKLGFADLINAMVTSEEAETEKPSPVMFHLALDKVAARPDETIYIGDAVKKDVKGALNAGITPVWFTAQREIDETKAPTGIVRIKDYFDKRLTTMCGVE